MDLLHIFVFSTWFINISVNTFSINNFFLQLFFCWFFFSLCNFSFPSIGGRVVLVCKVCVCARMCEYVSTMCTSIHVEARGPPWLLFLWNYPPCFLRHALSLGPEAQLLNRRNSRWKQVPPPHRWDSNCALPPLTFYVGTRGQTQVLMPVWHTLWTKPSLQLLCALISQSNPSHTLSSIYNHFLGTLFNHRNR